METAKVEVEEVYTTRAMTSFGIARFKTRNEKRKFNKWLASQTEQLKHKGKSLRLSDNKSKDKRTKGRAVAKVKRAPMEGKLSKDRCDGGARPGKSRLGH